MAVIAPQRQTSLCLTALGMRARWREMQRSGCRLWCWALASPGCREPLRPWAAPSGAALQVTSLRPSHHHSMCHSHQREPDVTVDLHESIIDGASASSGFTMLHASALQPSVGDISTGTAEHDERERHVLSKTADRIALLSRFGSWELSGSFENP